MGGRGEACISRNKTDTRLPLISQAHPPSSSPSPAPSHHVCGGRVASIVRRCLCEPQASWASGPAWNVSSCGQCLCATCGRRWWWVESDEQRLSPPPFAKHPTHTHHTPHHTPRMSSAHHSGMHAVVIPRGKVCVASQEASLSAACVRICMQAYRPVRTNNKSISVRTALHIHYLPAKYLLACCVTI